MCYAIPAQIIEIKYPKAIIDYYGEKRNILLDDTKVKVGDYVYAQGGVFVRKIPASEAKKILKVFEDIFFELKKVDASLSKLDQDKIPANLLAVLQKVNLQKSLKKEELLTIAKLNNPAELSVLYEIANHIRQREHGNASCVHGIIEFSNYCQNSCFYCGIRQEQKIPRYRMSINEIVQAAKKAVKDFDFKALVLQSGEDYYYTDEILAEIVRKVKKLGVLVFISIGSRSKETYEKLYIAGARAALIRFETSNPHVFQTLRPPTTLDQRIDLIKHVRKIGYVLATGFILGLPGDDSEEAILNNILLTKSLAPDMYSFGPLIPSKNTPLATRSPISIELVLKTIALARIADPNSNILVTTALETLDANAKKQGLLAGANSMMINLTPTKYKKLYHIYDNRAGLDAEVAQSVQETVDLLKSLGRSPTDIGL